LATLSFTKSEKQKSWFWRLNLRLYRLIPWYKSHAICIRLKFSAERVRNVWESIVWQLCVGIKHFCEAVRNDLAIKRKQQFVHAASPWVFSRRAKIDALLFSLSLFRYCTPSQEPPSSLLKYTSYRFSGQTENWRRKKTYVCKRGYFAGIILN